MLLIVGVVIVWLFIVVVVGFWRLVCCSILVRLFVMMILFRFVLLVLVLVRV